jgi:AcrR family transcriptional regulator
MSDTKRRLIDGTIEAIREHGISGVSARTIAAAAGVNQALVFYHFGTVSELLNAACEVTTRERIEDYRERFAGIGSLRELLVMGRELFAEEGRRGNVTVLTQLLAGAQSDPKLAPSTAGSLRLWVEEIEPVLRRLLAGSPVAGLVDPAGLARAVSAGFIGIQLYGAVDEDGAEHALAALEQLGLLMELVDDLGPAARRIVRARATKAAKNR